MQIYEVPGTFRRLSAKGIDRLINALFFIPLVFSFRSVGSEGLFTFDWRIFVACLLMSLFFSTVWLYLFNASIGKQLMSLKVRSVNGDPSLTWSQAVVRSIAEVMNSLLSDMLVIFMFLRHDRRHLVDWMAETEVVSSHTRKKPPVRRPFIFIIFLILTILGAVNQSRSIAMFIQGSLL